MFRQFREKRLYLQNLKLNFIKESNVPVKFDNNIQENFIKIVTNIFYINSYKTWIDWKNSDKSDRSKKLQKVEEIYQKNLKSTRKIVYEYFKIPKLSFINSKYLVRLYPHSLAKDHPIRVKYTKFSDIINIILENLSNNIVPEIFLKEFNVEVLNVKYIFNYKGGN